MRGNTSHSTDKETEMCRGYITCMKITNHQSGGCLNFSPKCFSLQLVFSVEDKSKIYQRNEADFKVIAVKQQECL